MLHEALNAAEALGARVQVVNMPWLNRVDSDWLADLVGYTAEEWMAGSDFFADVLHPDDREKTRAEPARLG